jgi:cystathionine beta-lyase/cystathionine gamma-synthase
MNAKHPRPWNDQLEAWAISSSERQPEDGHPQAESISVSSVWQMDSPASANDALSGESGAFVYRRDGHPNERSLATKLAKSHGAQRAIVTAQGMSAIGAIAIAVLKPGDQVWIGKELYGKSTKLFCVDMVRWGIITRTFDPTNSGDLTELSRSSARLVLVETMSNPRLGVPDIAAVAQATHSVGGLLLVDNTFATHLICQPLLLGADLVIESLSKQVNGHSDSMLGLVAASDETLAGSINSVVSTFGMASSPLDCYLTHRGLMSLALRLERACGNALALSKALSKHPAVQSVDYPGLPTHAQHELANTQFCGGYGWMLCFSIDGTQADLKRVFDALRPEIPFAPSLGDINTTVSHPATTSHRVLNAAQREDLGIHEGTIRVSCGAEPSDWLVQRFCESIEVLGPRAH